jgi:adenylate cyclase
MTRWRDLVRREPERGIQLPAWAGWLISFGIVSGDPQVVRRQRCVNVAAYVIAANAASHFIINAFYDFHGLAIVNVYNALIVLTMLSIPRLHRFGEDVAAIALIILLIAGNLFVVWALGVTSDLHIYFTLAGGMLFFFGVRKWKLFLVFFIIVTAVLLFTLNYAPVDGFVLPQDGRLRDMLSTHAMINTITMNAAIIFYVLNALHRAEADLAHQYQRSEALVTTMMPAAIAERLKSGAEERIADRIDNLSVLFTDLVGFTNAAQGLPPEQVVDYLDHMVREFDGLAEAHGIEKIKTIGDAYMAAAGFDGEAENAAIAIGRFALALLDANGRQPALGERKLALRIGIHCGPATAGVIGDTRFSYDVWGAAVNVASRMESHGAPGRIHVSEAFRDLTATAFAFDERGSTDIKSIGETRTFFLMVERQAT